MKTRKTNKISDNTIRRLPRYLRCLDELERQGNTRVSSAMIGNHLNNTPSQVRQDLSQFGSYGMQGYGYNIESLRASIHAILGIAITNLPPRAMMGIDSCGMLLSAIHEEEGEEKLHLLMVDDHIPAGAKLY